MTKPTERSPSSSYRSQKATIADLSILEKLQTIPVLLTVVANVFASIFTAAYRPKEQKPPGLLKYVAFTAMRTIFRISSVRQQHYLFAPTDDCYIVACKARNFTPNSEVLEDGTRAHWIGSSTAEKLILNFHGGGYVVPASKDMFEFMFQIVDVLKKQNKDVSVLMLSYDLAPGAVYPRQLQQAAALLDHVINKLHISPSNIVLTGDSAGANLCVALLSHITHPHPSPSIPVITLPSKLCAAVLISPWVSFSFDEPSATRNKYKDIIDKEAGKKWSSAFLGEQWPQTKKSDNYNEATKAPAEWWNDLQVEQVLIVAAGGEVLIDGIIQFEKTFSQGMGAHRVELCVVPNEYHDQAPIDLSLGYTEKNEGGQAKKIKSWISSKL